ncbi:transcriptional regulator [Haematobacter missouriensis]|uniref:NepR family anti-sigma factor n=1 Tax=Haematobacter missouriensis TaxID=366616 RepID=UPI0004E96328|nr:NepR family anti-sigma factor [Haematobacter missouriensis]KFI33702.1 transcriptional regulator [Haematobacter missouriensis]
MTDKPKEATLRLQIDENLRRVYQEKVEEAIPSRLMDLLSRLKDQDQAADSDNESTL